MNRICRPCSSIDGKVGCLGGLNAVDRVEHDHSFVDVDGVILKSAARAVAAPDAKQSLSCHLLHLLDDLPQFFRQRLNGPLFNQHFATVALADDDVVFAQSADLSGKSSRNWAPRLSFSKPGRPRDGFRDVEQVVEIHSGVPTVVVLPIPGDAGAGGWCGVIR